MDTVVFLSRHQPTPAQLALAAELGLELRPVNIELPGERQALAAALRQAGVGEGAPVALVAPVAVVEAVRRLGHPVVVFAASARGVTVDAAQEVRVHLLCGLRPLQWDGPGGPASEEVWPHGWFHHPWAVA